MMNFDWPVPLSITDYQYQTTAQAIDQRTELGLACTPQLYLRFFLSPPVLPGVEDGFSVEDGLRQLLASLPQSKVDQCVPVLHLTTLRESAQSLAAQRVRDAHTCTHQHHTTNKNSEYV
ncbi:protein SERAC1-like [Coregonus clupeaformis]|uniref:protein SERAC1-like n=1 Tax=Coregonus clupeaformis TaxID=59861 RepID=UPI001BE03611|nr:protein SERAC1-like [Coregonus clupeaformis]